MDDEAHQKLVKKIKIDLRGVLISSASKGGLSLDQLNRDYKEMNCKPVPFRELGFDSLPAMLQTFKDVCSIYNGLIFPVATQETAHTLRLVQGQKKKTKAKGGRSRPARSRFANAAPSFPNRRGGSFFPGASLVSHIPSIPRPSTSTFGSGAAARKTGFGRPAQSASGFAAAKGAVSRPKPALTNPQLRQNLSIHKSSVPQPQATTVRSQVFPQPTGRVSFGNSAFGTIAAKPSAFGTIAAIAKPSPSTSAGKIPSLLLSAVNKKTVPSVTSEWGSAGAIKNEVKSEPKAAEPTKPLNCKPEPISPSAPESKPKMLTQGSMRALGYALKNNARHNEQQKDITPFAKSSSEVLKRPCVPDPELDMSSGDGSSAPFSPSPPATPIRPSTPSKAPICPPSPALSIVSTMSRLTISGARSKRMTWENGRVDKTDDWTPFLKEKTEDSAGLRKGKLSLPVGLSQYEGLDSIHFVRSGVFEQIKEIEESLKTAYGNRNKAPLDPNAMNFWMVIDQRDIKVGLHCVVNHPEFGYCRVVVESMDKKPRPTKVVVKSLDFGTTMEVAPGKLHLIPKHLATTPALAHRVRMAGWNPEVLEVTDAQALEDYVLRFCSTDSLDHVRLAIDLVEKGADGIWSVNVFREDANTGDWLELAPELMTVGHVKQKNA